MSHHSYRPRGPRFEADADYVVIGSGAGGATAAVSLARGGASVAVVEAGAWRDPEHYPSSVYGAMRDLFDDWGLQLTRGRVFWPVVQARCVGGTTVINSAIVVRTPGDVFADWTEHHGIDGAAMGERLWTYQDELEHELHVEPVPDSAAGRSNELALAASRAMNIEGHVIHRNVRGCMGTGQCLQGCRAERKQSTNLNFIPAVLKLGGHVVSTAPVERVVLEGQRAIGVTGRFVHPRTRKKGAEFFVRANKGVLVAASCTHSPALLQRSGVQSAALGGFFRAHPGTGVFGVYDDPVDMNTGATQGWASTHWREEDSMKLETLSLPPELVASRLSGGGRQLMERLSEYRHLAMWVAAIRAETVGTVHWSRLARRPVVRYDVIQRDIERLRRGLHRVAKMHVAVGARALIPGIYGMPYKLAPDEVDKILDAPLDPRCYTGILSHLFGGCVMGADPQRSVCDEDGKVHGYEGLFIADASQIPSTLGVNPQHTIMALARLRAHHLLEG